MLDFILKSKTDICLAPKRPSAGVSGEEAAETFFALAASP